MRNIFLTTLALAALAIAAPQSSAAPMIVDDFSTTTLGVPAQQQFGVGTAGPTADGPNAGIMGDYRTLTTEVESGAGGARIQIDTANQRALFSSDADVDAKFTLLYDGNGAGLGASFSSAGNFVLDIEGVDLSNLSISVTFMDNTNSFTQSTMLVSAGPQTISFPLSGFTGVDVAQTKSIQIVFDSVLDQDFIVSGGGRGPRIPELPIPEPTSLAVWGLASLAGVWYGRRRLQKQAA